MEDTTEQEHAPESVEQRTEANPRFQRTGQRDHIAVLGVVEVGFEFSGRRRCWLCRWGRGRTQHGTLQRQRSRCPQERCQRQTNISVGPTGLLAMSLL